MILYDYDKFFLNSLHVILNLFLIFQLSDMDPEKDFEISFDFLILPKQISNFEIIVSCVFIICQFTFMFSYIYKFFSFIYWCA